ncbi:MAG: class I SAM-dependent methyltransferase [Motiliproteus sp.]
MSVPDLDSLINTAVQQRHRLLEQWHAEATDCYRLFHGASEGMAGVTVDRYGPQLIIQSFHHALEPSQQRQILDRVNASLQSLAVDPLSGFYMDRSSKGVAAISIDLQQPVINEATCHEMGVSYRSRGIHRGIDPLLFLDLRVGRRFVRQQAQGLSVLNLFSYTCGVGISAAMAGATKVINVDFATSSLAVGRENAALNDLNERHIEFIQSDFFPAVQQLAGQPVKFRRGGGRGRGASAPKHYPRLDAQQFDLVFLDPPRWAKSPFGTVDLIRDYASVFKPSLLATKPGGRLVCTNNVAQVDRNDWLDQLQRSAAKAGRPIRSVEWLQPEADFPSFDGNHPLKLVVLDV